MKLLAVVLVLVALAAITSPIAIAQGDSGAVSDTETVGGGVLEPIAARHGIPWQWVVLNVAAVLLAVNWFKMALPGLAGGWVNLAVAVVASYGLAYAYWEPEWSKVFWGGTIVVFAAPASWWTLKRLTGQVGGHGG